MDGAGNIEDNFLGDPAGPYHATALRRIDPVSGEWTINWFDQRYSSVDPAMRGYFEGNTGTFLCDAMLDGAPIHMRFIWSRIDSDNPRWEQAFSPDGGTSWETNWIMDFERTG
jgi:hypothetical protein